MAAGEKAGRSGGALGETPPVTVAEALRLAAQALRSGRYAHMDDRSARNEAEWLLSWVAGWNRTTLLVSLPDALSPEVWVRFWEAVERRVNGEPLQYITGEASFFGRRFHVEPGCLIPRPETELLAEATIAYISSDNGRLVRTADIGTGSGALAVTIALECPQARVSAVDVSAEALRIAKGNAAHLGAAARVTFVLQDGIEWLASQSATQAASEAAPQAAPQTAPQAAPQTAPGGLHVLISNPPYIASEDILSLDPDVRDHEPRLALDGGRDGLDFYRRLAALGQGIFAPGPAAIFLEVGHNQAKDVIDLFAAPDADFAGWTFDALRDLQGIDRVVRGVRSAT
jgi:release factor glutamine methyltransferase